MSFLIYRNGHSLLALRMSRSGQALSPDKTLELGHHILKAHLFKNATLPKFGHLADIYGASTSKEDRKDTVGLGRDMQAYWVSLVSQSPSAALVTPHNLYATNVKVRYFSFKNKYWEKK